MPGVVRMNADSHVGHAGYRVPFHKTYYGNGVDTVFANYEKLVCVGNSCVCGDRAAAGSATVFAGFQAVHRQGDATTGHGNWVPNSASTGSSDVFAG